MNIGWSIMIQVELFSNNFFFDIFTFSRKIRKNSKVILHQKNLRIKILNRSVLRQNIKFMFFKFSY